VFEQLDQLLELARSIGWGAADILRQAQQCVDMTQDITSAGESPVTQADLAANRYILDNLQSALGQHDCAYLSEETYQSQPPQERLSQEWVWIIDPLDGTKDFIKGTGEYAVHLALTHQGKPVLAVVACPGLGKLYSAQKGQGTWVETVPGDRTAVHVSQTQNPQDMVVLASRSHRNPQLERLLSQIPHREQRSIGSVGCKIAALVEGQADVYIALSGKSAPKEWDFAAPELILTEAGGELTRFDGSPLVYNQRDVSLWGGLLASNGVSHPDLCARASQIVTAAAGSQPG
jgi:3'(2'), 5'-bisphosphate nucleotidase